MGLDEPYNPLDKHNLGRNVVGAVLQRPEQVLCDIVPFNGAGIYVIYYKGKHPLYSELSQTNRAAGVVPIYVGKAIPKGGRKGASTIATSSSYALMSRLADHAKSIDHVSSLDVSDFTCRHLAVDDIWISLGETLLIDRFQPVWNVVVEGFGNHDPGKGRYGGRRPLWDELHPGRPWASRCAPPKMTKAEIEESVRAYLKKRLGGS